MRLSFTLRPGSGFVGLEEAIVLVSKGPLHIGHVSVANSTNLTKQILQNLWPHSIVTVQDRYFSIQIGHSSE